MHRYCVHAARSVFDLNVILQQKVKPSFLLAYRPTRFLQKREGCVVCADDDFSSYQMLAVLLQAIYYAKKFLSRDAIASFGIRERASRITYYVKLSVLPAPRVALSEASMSRTYCPSSHGGTKMGADMSHSFKAVKASLHS